jgi:hypothetical protein
MPDDRTLRNMASATAHDFLVEALRNIDSELGQGYAKANPVLVAAMLQASAAALHASQLSVRLDDLADTVGRLNR